VGGFPGGSAGQPLALVQQGETVRNPELLATLIADPRNPTFMKHGMTDILRSRSPSPVLAG
jgi:hypothetical protein